MAIRPYAGRLEAAPRQKHNRTVLKGVATFWVSIYLRLSVFTCPEGRPGGLRDLWFPLSICFLRRLRIFEAREDSCHAIFRCTPWPA